MAEEKPSSVSRREVLKLAATAIIAGAVAGVGGYYIGSSSVKKPTAGGVKPAKVGVIYPLSGSLAKPGTDARDAFLLVEEKINEAGGIKSLGGAPLRFIFADSRGEPKTAAAEAERLITEEHVCMLAGCYASSNTFTAAPVAEKHHIPFINPESTSPKLIQQGWKWFFRLTPDDDLFARNFFEFLKELKEKKPDLVSKYPLETAAVVYENTLWGASMGALEKKYAPENGYKVVLDLPYSHQAPDLSSEVLKIKEANADVLMLTSYLTDAILLVKTLKSYDVIPKIVLATDVGYDHPDFFAAVGKDGDYIINRENYAPDMKKRKKAAKEADDAYFARFGKHFDGTSIRAYVGAEFIADVLERVGACDPDVLRKTILATDETIWPPERLPTAWDGIKFDPNTGQNILVHGIMVQTFNATPYTIWPWNVASRDIVYPFPSWKERT